MAAARTRLSKRGSAPLAELGRQRVQVLALRALHQLPQTDFTREYTSTTSTRVNKFNLQQNSISFGAALTRGAFAIAPTPRSTWHRARAACAIERSPG